VQTADSPVIDWPAFGEARAALGANFARILGYFREDGAKAVAAIEDAMRSAKAGAMVGPAETLKTSAFELGAQTLGALAEYIEFAARDCLDCHQSPTPLLEQVIQLRPLLERSLEQLDRESNPLMNRREVPRHPNINSYVTRRAG
jgi:histidine phosphotransfer protein HptB